jgi:hypothetical protein
MISIDKSNVDVQFALKEHLRFTSCLVKRRIGFNKCCGDLKCPILNSRLSSIDGVPIKIIDLLSDSIFLDSIITGEPKDLQLYNELFLREVLGDFVYDSGISASLVLKKERTKEEDFYFKCFNNILNIVGDIFDYEGWFVANEPSSYYSAYHLATYLGLRSCVYCNRTYTVSQFKIDKGGEIKKLIRPQFDHWFPKENFPLLALSFFNLIPSCSICNSSVKGRKEFTLSKYVHPYEDNVIDSIVFSYSHDISIDSLKIEVSGVNSDSILEKRINNTLKDFFIEEMYNAHHLELKDLIDIKRAYSENYLKSLKESFPEAKLADDEIYRMVFGTEINSFNFHKRPFSKFKFDILKELGVI